MKIRQTKSDLMEALKDNISNLIDLCEGYDRGDKSKGKLIATLLRALFHHNAPKRSSHSLLTKLSLINNEWIAFEAPVPVFQEIDTCVLVCWSISSAEPNFSMFSVRKLKSFRDWWEQPVANSLTYGEYSRRDFVLAIADQEGAHTDPALDEKYIALKNGSFVSNIRAINGKEEKHIPNVHYASIRQIAHETLVTLKIICPEAFIKEYTFKTLTQLEEEKLDREVLTKFAGNADKLNEYGAHIHLKYKDLNRALVFYDQALGVNPNHVHALGNMALIYAGQDKQEHAEIFFKRAISIDPTQSKILANYGLFLAKKNSPDAEFYFLEALKFDKDNLSALINYPKFLALIKQDLVNADKLFKSALERFPDEQSLVSEYEQFLNYKKQFKYTL